jgi:hypothetical protein
MAAMPDDEPIHPERSESGQPIYRYEEPIDQTPELSHGDEELIAGLEAHLHEWFGDYDGHVFHEIISPTVHLDVHLVPPNDKLDAWLCVTSGMAERPMSPPPDAIAAGGNDCRWAELVTLLPPDWPLFEKDDLTDADDAEFWPIGWMKFLARFPHEHAAWLWHGHTIPNGDPPEPFAGSRLVGSMLLAGIPGLDGFESFTAGDREVQLLLCLPLTAAEMSYKLRVGGDELLDRLSKADVPPWVVPDRPDAVAHGEGQPRNKWWPFGR